MNKILFTAIVYVCLCVYSGSKTILSNTKTLSRTSNTNVYSVTNKSFWHSVNCTRNGSISTSLPFHSISNSIHLQSSFLLLLSTLDDLFVFVRTFFSPIHCQQSADRCSIVCATKSKLNAAPSFILAFFLLFICFFLLLLFCSDGSRDGVVG